MSTLSIYDVVADLVREVDVAIERLIESALDAARDCDAFTLVTDARRLRGILLDLCVAQDDNIDAIFTAVNDLDCYLVCPF